MNCEYCDKELIRKEREKPFEFKKRRFCDHKCLGLFHRKKALEGVKRYCKRCGKELFPVEGQQAYRFRRRNVCSVYTCVPKVKKIYPKKPAKKCRVCENKTNSTYCSKECRESYWMLYGRREKKQKSIIPETPKRYSNYAIKLPIPIYQNWC